MFTLQVKRSQSGYGIKAIKFQSEQNHRKDQVIINTVTLRLDRIKTEYLKLNLQYQKEGRQLTKEQLKDEFDIVFKGKQKKETPNDLESCFTDFCEFKFKEGSWSKSTKQRYMMFLGLLNEYEKYKSKDN